MGSGLEILEVFGTVQGDTARTEQLRVSQDLDHKYSKFDNKLLLLNHQKTGMEILSGQTDYPRKPTCLLRSDLHSDSDSSSSSSSSSSLLSSSLSSSLAIFCRALLNTDWRTMESS